MPIDTIIEQGPADTGEQSGPDEATLADAGFYWRESSGIRVLMCRALNDAGFVNGFSTRVGGVSPFPVNDLNLAGYDEDLLENIEENRRRFLAALDVSWPIAAAWQVHGDDVLTIGSLGEARNSDERADAVASNIARILAAVKTADCVPVLIGDTNTGAFAAVHAGWRGTVRSIVSKAIATLRSQFGTSPADLTCAIGPAACGRSYEVGSDVIDAFAANFPNGDTYFSPTREGHALVDLHRANRDQLISSGVHRARIFTAPFCTMERPDLFFSYRLEKQRYGRTGRLLSVIGRRP